MFLNHFVYWRVDKGKKTEKIRFSLHEARVECWQCMQVYSMGCVLNAK